MIAHVEEQRREASEHRATPDETTDVFGVVHAGHVRSRKGPLYVVVQTEQGGGVHDDQRGDVEEDQQGDVDLVAVLPRVPAGEGGAQQLHGGHQVEHKARNGHVDKVNVWHGHRHLVGEIDHDEQHIVAQPQWEANQEVDEGEDREDEAKVLAEPDVHAAVRLVGKQADPHCGPLTQIKRSTGRLRAESNIGRS